MPIGVIKRGRGRPRKTPASSTSINSFATVSKTPKLSTKKEAALNAAISAISTSTSTSTSTSPPKSNIAVILPARKRKAITANVTSDSEDNVAFSTPTKKKTSPATKRVRRSNGSTQQPQQSSSTPTTTTTPGTNRTSSRHAKSQLTFVRASSTESDLSVANNTLSRLRLGGNVAASSSHPIQFSGSSSYATPVSSDSEPDEVPSSSPLPQDLEDICALFASFLKTLSLHASYANGGAIACKALLPDVSRSWGKRSVTVADLRLLVGVLDHKRTQQQQDQPHQNNNNNNNVLKLSDYGRGRVHVEMTSQVLPLKEKAMRTAFEKTLAMLWSREKANYFDTIAFLEALPRANVVKKPVSRIGTPKKGQQTLEMFKASVAAKKAEADMMAKACADAAAAAAAAATKSHALMTNGPTKKISVLDRVRAKETLLAKLSSAASSSPEECARRRCLQRCPEVAAVMSMLCTSSLAPGGSMARVSFPMTTMAEKLKDSLRMSLSADEGLQAVRMIGLEVAPEWVKVMRVGGKEHVVMMRGFVPSKGEVERRVKNKLA